MDSEETIIAPVPAPEPAPAPPPEKKADPEPKGAPKQLLSVPDGIFLMIGMIIGVGIFETPSRVAGNVANVWEFFGVWIIGGVVSLCGALVYAELAARHPATGGEYTFLSRGLGSGVAFLFAWSRMAVIQTGAIAAVAFIFGNYATQMYPLGPASTAIYAALSVVALTALNVVGTLQSKSLQRVMETILIAGLLVLAAAGFLASGEPRPAPQTSGGGAIGLALMFVFFTYGGWNEAAYLSGEVRDAPKNMTRILVVGIVSVTVLYLVVNLGYIAALGFEGVRESKSPAVDVMRMVAGDQGALVVALIVCISALTTINAAVFTGARTTWAFARDFRIFGRLADWREEGSTPRNALLLQGVVALLLVFAASFTRDGFGAMVDFTWPVFWTFFLLTGITLFVFRARGAENPVFKTPLYPLVPFVFCGMCVYMLYRAISYAANPDFGPKVGMMVVLGIAVMLAGIPLYYLSRRK